MINIDISVETLRLIHPTWADLLWLFGRVVV